MTTFALAYTADSDNALRRAVRGFLSALRHALEVAGRPYQNGNVPL
jgi:hypothetical protein